jgi:GrpB-like predicted nucleotidyltransferase (UPF0157 family)
VRRLLAKARATEDDLECGEQDGRAPGAIHHNCSGKHAGFLAVCQARGWETAGYRRAEHPLQQELHEEVALAAELGTTEIPTAVDGCGVVTFAISLERMARSFARLGQLDGAERILAAMRANPELVGGEGSLDTLLMSKRPGWVAKGGAEGLLCGVAPDGTGFALKSEDGNPRPLQAALAPFLGVELGPVLVESSRGDVVGMVGLDPEDVAAYEMRVARGRVGGPPRRLDRLIEIADYDPAWPGLYEREEVRLRAALGDRIVRVEHAGSTSVPGLPAKPIIDVVLEVADAADEDAYMHDLEAAGYVLRFRETDRWEHRLFRGPDTHVNLHVFTAGCEETNRMLLFRDHLRRDEADRVRYARAKRELATRNWSYRQQYADAKTAIVTEIMSRAEAAKQHEGNRRGVVVE